MRSKDTELLANIQEYVEKYCDTHGYGPSTRDVAEAFGIGSSSGQRYLAALEAQGRISKGERGYESNTLARTERSMRSVAIVGAIPCGPMAEMEEYVEGYIRLPESLIGQGKFFILTASGESMINAGIEDGDLVLIRQQETADVGDIVVALGEEGNTLKRLEYNEKKKRYYLHPENDNMEDIYVNELRVQGVAIKVLKDLM